MARRYQFMGNKFHFSCKALHVFGGGNSRKEGIRVTCVDIERGQYKEILQRADHH